MILPLDNGDLCPAGFSIFMCHDLQVSVRECSKCAHWALGSAMNDRDPRSGWAELQCVLPMIAASVAHEEGRR